MDQERDASQNERVSETLYVRLKPSTRALLESMAEGRPLSEAARSLIEKALEPKQEAA